MYSSKEELIFEIRKTFSKYIDEFDEIKEENKNLKFDEIDRTPAENLAYNLGWTTLLLKWENDELLGKDVKNSTRRF